MRTTALGCFLLIMLSHVSGLAQTNLFYYLPENVSLDAAVPTPEAVIGHEIGEWHLSHDKLVYYFYELVRASDKVQVEVYGYTHEHRPLLNVTITSAANHTRLEQIRQEHLKISDPYASTDMQSAPLVVRLGYSIHGNEASGSNAAPLLAYYLAAAQSTEIDSLLQKTVILIDPCLNPDGLQRFSNWVNQHKSENLVADQNNREFHEPWPSGRTNHYWFDLNRDWLLATQPESQARLQLFYKWRPNIQTDHHEMSHNNTFFFQPGITSRVYPGTPARTRELTEKIAAYHARLFDKNLRLYYSKESFDDYYLGKGSTYPDLNGAVGILFEQASSRGKLRHTENGLLSFPFTIKNQLLASLSTLKAGIELREELLRHQRDFYSSSLEMARKDEAKAIVFGNDKDALKAHYLADLLMKHQVQVYAPLKNVQVNDRAFLAGHSFIVPMAQPQYRLIKALFERRTKFEDSLFYDVSTWTMDLAYDVDIESLNNKNIADDLVGERVDTLVFPEGGAEWKSRYAYAIDWHSHNAPALVNQLLRQDLLLKVATEPFTDIKGRQHARGTVVLPLGLQAKSNQFIYDLIEKYANQYHVDVYALETGYTPDGVDIGSPALETITKPRIAMLVGTNVSGYEAGETWHLLDHQFGMDLTLLPVDILNRIKLNSYNVLLMPDGSYSALDAAGQEKIKRWVQDGGRIVAWKGALRWLEKANLAGFELAHNPLDTAAQVPYAAYENYKGARQIGGAIFNVRIDRTHPLFYGYEKDQLAMFKNSELTIKAKSRALAHPAYYTDKPRLSGYANNESIEHIKNTAAVTVADYGLGKIVAMADNPNFRGYWYSSTKLLMNAIYFTPIVQTK